MSLIGDALKKARAERGTDLPPNIYAVPAARPSRLPWILAAASTSLAIGIVVGGLLFYGSHRDAGSRPVSDPLGVEEAAPQAPEVAPTSPPTASLPPVSRVEESTEPSGSRPVESAAPQVATDDQPASTTPAVEPSPSRPSQAADTAPGTPPASQPTPAPAPGAAAPSPAASPVEGQSYFQRVQLQDGRTLHLHGIVWSDRSPTALINSEVYAVGEGAGPWRVRRVERAEVEIEADGVTFLLRLK